ncbi:proline-rich protein HaeIII subfamily 1-like [Physeter macrocephalus]|uniref:Proline-rich protein HaeIII subfamily 1-like n=1 Tax=Physeter macrocephalus TaxID=9755 RepID=A0A455BGP6_PHYMC|nr:proline-rich protein HaeIII subfamily 1-like [Physeter catodon]|eukprot:XP_028343131.1 proline-rich protein HaeIII subfamily 1-like [Physeter catodon]
MDPLARRQSPNSGCKNVALPAEGRMPPIAGSGDPPPLPSAPAPLRANAPLREGPGLPRSGSQDQSAPASGLHRPPCSRASRDSMGTPEAEDTAGPGAVHCSRRSGLRTQRGCLARWVPGRADAGLGRSVPPAFRSPVPGPTLPRAMSPPGTAYRPRQGPSATKGRLSQRSIRFPSSSPKHIFQGLQSATLEPPLSTHGPHSQSCEARFSSIGPTLPVPQSRQPALSTDQTGSGKAPPPGGRQLSLVRPTSADSRGPRAATPVRRRPLVEPLRSPPSVQSGLVQGHSS